MLGSALGVPVDGNADKLLVGTDVGRPLGRPVGNSDGVVISPVEVIIDMLILTKITTHKIFKVCMVIDGDNNFLKKKEDQKTVVH